MIALRTDELRALAPTDEAIMAWAMSHQTDAIKVLRGSGFVRVARAVLAKWGTPAPASQPVAVPAGMEPVAWVEVHPGLDGWFLAYGFNPDAKTEPLYTAAQVQAMGRVPPGWQAVLVEPTKEMKVAAVKFANGPAVYKAVATAALEIEEEICAEAYEAMLAAAPQPPAPSGPALEPVDKSPNLQCQAVDKSPETQGCGPAREPLTPEQLVTCMQLAGFTTWDSRMWELKRQIEAALGITAAQKGDAPK